MNRRFVLATVAVVVLIVLAGCSMVFGGISDEELDQDAEYDDLRDSDADVAMDIEGGSLLGSGEFRAVYDLNETEELSLYRSNFYRDEALDIHSVRYWYPNGTMLTGSEIEVDQGRSSTDIVVPDGNGTLAFSGDAGSKTFQLPAFVEGSYEITLPEDHRTTNFLFGNVNPGGYDREMVDDGTRERLVWSDVDSTISIRFYHTRDIPLFLGLVGVVTLVGGAGIAYYYRKTKRLKEQREELGLDVDVEDDNDGPPPGMR